MTNDNLEIILKKIEELNNKINNIETRLENIDKRMENTGYKIRDIEKTIPMLYQIYRKLF